MDSTKEMQIQSYGLYLNEMKQRGVSMIPIDQHIKLFEHYIELSEYMQRSHEKFSNVMDILRSFKK
ncbi:hypothetical protein [Paenibacillus cremeus]|uniref:Uncharacterized protein n=1 Tax=Paenibacillus cremeus TaxID=2163881 RepID=A0A559KCH9_9BACL|nr:hypothetical protein [Paenibacillus cremeus]TVY09825.1 hypothetical protein FPZ49_10645 [Paenibacillus cremeus]